MKKQAIWFALVGVVPLEGNELITDVSGAYVNVVALSTDEVDFTYKSYEVFAHHKFSCVRDFRNLAKNCVEFKI
jgi:hypothetical protein